MKAEERQRGCARYASLFEAIGEGSAEGVSKLLAAGADPDLDGVEEADDRRPLMEAAARGDLEIARLLVAAGADVNTMVDDFTGDLDPFPFLDELFQHGKLRGMTALAYAALFDRPEMYEFLIPLTSAERQAEVTALREARERWIDSKPRRPARPAAAPRESAKQARGEELLDARPGLRRWMNECPLCGRKGYKPDLPEEVDSRGSAAELRRHFKPLPLTSSYACDRCSEKVQRAMAQRAARRARL
jgi:hypothetical protein